MDDLEVPPFQETSISIVFMGVVKTNFGQGLANYNHQVSVYGL